MKRRDFLKAVGATLAGGPLVLVPSKKKLYAEKIASKGISQKTEQKTCREVFDGIRLPPKHPNCRCAFVFMAKECGYTGPDFQCSSLFSDCKVKGNAERFGGFSPMEKHNEWT